MYITVKTLKKTLGKYIEMTDLFIGLPFLIIFIILFSINMTRVFSLILLTVFIFLMLPINLSKKNRMYKVIWLVFIYIFKCKDYIYQKEYKRGEYIEKRKKIKTRKNN